MADLLAALDSGVLLGDGAMGTELLRRGVPRDRCLPELNLSRPDLVQAIHEDYARAGARVHRTNTLTANRIRLAPFGLEDRVREINQAAVAIARKAAGPDGFVVGSVGPLPVGEFKGFERPSAYREQAFALREAGCDLILLETFTAGHELKSAVVSIPSAANPLALSVAIGDRSHARDALRSSDSPLIGMNCRAPSHIAAVLMELGSSRRTFAFPSPGMPGQTASSEEFARACEPLLDLGVKILGGCCGAGPEHVRALAAILRRPRPSA